MDLQTKIQLTGIIICVIVAMGVAFYWISYERTYQHELLHYNDCVELGGIGTIMITPNFENLTGMMWKGKCRCDNLTYAASQEMARRGNLIDNIS